MSLSRREFSKLMISAAAIGLIDNVTAKGVFAQTKRSMLWLSEQTASGEGKWSNLAVEGKVPRDLYGTLFRTAPSITEKYGTRLNHLFDGDAYLSSWRFRDGKVELVGRFLPTPERIREAEAKRMLFNEFGTFAENPRNNGKNQPNVNVIEWNGKLLGLSETGLPTLIDPTTFDFGGYEDFKKGIPDYLTFTAHPRIDSRSGDMYGWGVEKRPPGHLHIYHIERRTNAANRIHKLALDGVYMIHDAMLTENYFLLVVPPMQYDIQSVLAGAKTFGDALEYKKEKPSRLFVFPRGSNDGSSKPIEIELPGEIAFHYGNAYEADKDNIVFEMISGADSAILEWLRRWRRNEFLQPDSTYLTQSLKQVTVNITNRSVVERVELAETVEFPRYDLRLTGQKSRFLYATEKSNAANAAIVRVDLFTRRLQRVAAGRYRTYGEPVFTPKSSSANEDQGWLLTQGYDSNRNETFLEIRDAQTLGFQCRVWAAGQHFSLGFHGNFYPGI